MHPIRALGLMSGTSLDGVDLALVETDGETIAGFGPTGFRAYTPTEQAVLRAALEEGRAMTSRADRSPVLAAAEVLITRAHADAVTQFLAAEAIEPASVGVIGFHGQTVIHRPDLGFTVQIGDGPGLARAVGPPVVHDFRAADMAAGGQGAPLVPVFHRALVQGGDLAQPVAVVNIGGVSNVSYIDDGRDPIACDTGPGGALLDDFMRERTGEPMDRDGRAAERGRVHNEALARFLDDPFFQLAPPKSLDRNAFDRSLVAELGTEDGAATLTAFTARAIAAIVPHLPKEPETWIVAGGGAFNPTLRRDLRVALGKPVLTAEAVGWSVAALEAQAFAFLAVRSLRGLPLTFPSTTGVSAPASGGVLAVPD
jgi:anhydro-N-acetylmuramic acid kinase